MASQEFYCGVINTGDIGVLQHWLGETLRVGTGEMDISSDEIAEFARAADQMLNATLSQTYHVPLRKINRSGEVKYPDQIVVLAKKLTASLAIQARSKDFTQASIAKKWEEEVVLELNKIISGIGAGITKLDGQRLKGKNRFVRPTVVPVPQPGEVRTTPGGAIG